MWSGGFSATVSVPPTPSDAAGAAALSEQNANAVAEREEDKAAVQAASNELNDASQNFQEATRKRGQAESDFNTWKSQHQGRDNEYYAERNKLAEHDKQLDESYHQYELKAFETANKFGLAATLKAVYQSQLYSYLFKEKCASNEESMNKAREMWRVIIAHLQQAAKVEAQWEKTGGRFDTNLNFASYVDPKSAPQDGSLSYQATAESDQRSLFAQWGDLARRFGDPFYSDVVNRAGARLAQARSMFDQTSAIFAGAESNTNAADMALHGARETYDGRQAEVREDEAVVNGNNVALGAYDGQLRQDAAEREKQRLLQQQQQPHA